VAASEGDARVGEIGGALSVRHVIASSSGQALTQRGANKDQDRVALFKRKDSSSVLPLGCLSTYVACIADGAGGVASGAEAADIVLQCAQEFAEGSFASVYDALAAAEQRISAIGAMSTAVICVIEHGGVHGAYCGDSKAWLRNGKELFELTDRSHIPWKSALLGDGSIPTSFSASTIAPGARLVLATDGAWKYCRWNDFERMVCGVELTQCGEQILSNVRLPNGSYVDDATLLIVDL
jgi:serine/threonine protein phosphatase PrpC